MLKVLKNQLQKYKQRFVKSSYRSRLIAGFSIMVMLGFTIPYFSIGAGNTASAASGLSATASSDKTEGSIGDTAGVVYEYHQFSLRDAYPYYIAASFMVAGGLTLYAVSFIPARAVNRSRYASRFTTVARTTY